MKKTPQDGFVLMELVVTLVLVGFIGAFAKRSDIGVGFERRTAEDAVGDQVTLSLVPNWNLEWKNRLTSNIGFAYKKSTTVRNERESWESSQGVTLNLKYDIEGSSGIALPIPFLRKRLGFKSTLTTSLGVAYSTSVAFNRPRGSSLGITPNMSYRFSTSVMGSLGITYNRSWGGQYGYIYQQLGVRVETEFRF